MVFSKVGVLGYLQLHQFPGYALPLPFQGRHKMFAFDPVKRRNIKGVLIINKKGVILNNCTGKSNIYHNKRI
jgi:hypothetical protein